MCLIDAHDNKLVPDFMVRVEESDVWDIVELKMPCHPIVVDTGDRLMAAKQTAHAIAKGLEYREFFSRRENRRRIADRYGITAYEPTLVTVVGSGVTKHHYEWQSIRAGYPKVRVVSYDYLLQQAKNCRADIDGPEI